MKKNRISHLSTHDKKAIYALVQHLQADYGHDILKLMLFGSKARGDSNPDSDIDVLVVTSQRGWPFQSKILRLGARVSLEHDVLFSLCPIEQEDWNSMSQAQHPFYRAIESEGLNLSLKNMTV